MEYTFKHDGENVTLPLETLVKILHEATDPFRGTPYISHDDNEITIITDRLLNKIK